MIYGTVVLPSGESFYKTSLYHYVFCINNYKVFSYYCTHRNIAYVEFQANLLELCFNYTFIITL